MKFTLEIELGNEAMQTGDDIAAMFRKLAEYFEGSTGQFDPPETGKVCDLNGNTIGKWQVTA